MEHYVGIINLATNLDVREGNLSLHLARTVVLLVVVAGAVVVMLLLLFKAVVGDIAAPRWYVPFQGTFSVKEEMVRY